LPLCGEVGLALLDERGDPLPEVAGREDSRMKPTSMATCSSAPWERLAWSSCFARRSAPLGIRAIRSASSIAAAASSAGGWTEATKPWSRASAASIGRLVSIRRAAMDGPKRRGRKYEVVESGERPIPVKPAWKRVPSAASRMSQAQASPSP